MADFGIDASVNVPDFTGASRGFTSGTEVFAGLFKDVGDLGVTAVKVADQNNVQNQTQQIEEGVSSILNDFGFRTEGNNSTGTPTELQGYAKQLANTHKAFNSGALKESNFSIRIDALSRRVRAQYPGYSAEIDTIINQTLGRSTANDLRKTLVSEWEAEQSGMDAADKQYRSDLSQARENGALYNVFPEFDRLVAEGKEPSKEEVYYKLGQYYGDKERIEQGQRKLQYEEANNKATVRTRVETAYEDVAQVSNQIIKTGTSGTDFQNLMKNLTNKQAKDWTEAELQEVTGAYAQLEANAKVQVLERLNNPAYNKLTKSQRDELVSRALEPLSIMKEAITQKDVGLINVFKTMGDTVMAKDVSDFLKLSGEKGDLLSTTARKVKVANSVFGPEATQMWLLGNSEANDSQNAALDALMKSSLASGTPIKDIIAKGKEVNPDQVDGNKTREVIDTSIKLLTSPSVPQKGKEAVVESLFGAGNAGFLDKFSTKTDSRYGRSERMMAFEKMMSPETTAAVLAASKNNPELLEKYKNTMGSAFTSLFKGDIDNVVSVTQFSDYISFNYNQVSKQFEAVSKGKSGAIFGSGVLPVDVSNIFYGLNEQWKVSSGKKSMDNLNRYLRMLDPAMKAAGLETDAALVELFTTSGAIGGGKAPGSLFTQLGEALSNASLNAGAAMGEGLRKEKEMKGQNIFDNPQDGEDEKGETSLSGAYVPPTGADAKERERQLSFVWHEFTGSKAEEKAYSSLMKANTPMEAAMAGVMYERPAGSQNGPQNAHNFKGRLANVKSVLAGTASEEAMQARAFFERKGMTPLAAAGIVGNLMAESGARLHTGAVNKGDGADGSNSVGIGQWNSDRAKALSRFMREIKD
jgi:hypothetical protein